MTNAKNHGILCKVFSFTDIRGHPREDIQMFEKNLHLTVLFDLYGELLTEAQSKMFDYYYNDDLSLSEIAENTGITRQGVRDSIRRTEPQLFEFEEKLGLLGRFRQMEEGLDDIARTARRIAARSEDTELQSLAREILARVDELKEND